MNENLNGWILADFDYISSRPDVLVIPQAKWGNTEEDARPADVIFNDNLGIRWISKQHLAGEDTLNLDINPSSGFTIPKADTYCGFDFAIMGIQYDDPDGNDDQLRYTIPPQVIPTMKVSIKTYGSASEVIVPEFDVDLRKYGYKFKRGHKLYPVYHWVGKFHILRDAFDIPARHRLSIKVNRPGNIGLPKDNYVVRLGRVCLGRRYKFPISVQRDINATSTGLVGQRTPPGQYAFYGRQPSYKRIPFTFRYAENPMTKQFQDMMYSWGETTPMVVMLDSTVPHDFMYAVMQTLDTAAQKRRGPGGAYSTIRAIFQETSGSQKRPAETTA